MGLGDVSVCIYILYLIKIWTCNVIITEPIITPTCLCVFLSPAFQYEELEGYA